METENFTEAQKEIVKELTALKYKKDDIYEQFFTTPWDAQMAWLIIELKRRLTLVLGPSWIDGGDEGFVEAMDGTIVFLLSHFAERTSYNMATFNDSDPVYGDPEYILKKMNLAMGLVDNIVEFYEMKTGQSVENPNLAKFTLFYVEMQKIVSDKEEIIKRAKKG